MNRIEIQGNARSRFDAIVEGWNDANTRERNERKAQCKQEGHDKVEVWFQGKRLYVLCSRCCTYFSGEQSL